MSTLSTTKVSDGTKAAADLYVTAELIAKAGSADALRAMMLPIVTMARAEPGCKHCALIEVQSEAGHLLTYEIWTDRASLDAHMDKPHIKELRSKIRDLLSEASVPKFLFYDAVSPG